MIAENHTEIGGREKPVRASPSLRTGRADLPHPALQLVVMFWIDMYTWNSHHGERSPTCWPEPLCHQSQSTSVALQVRAYEQRIRLARNSRVLAFRQWTMCVFPFAPDPPSYLPLLHAHYCASSLLWRL